MDFKAKTLLITGGTGSFGNAVLNRFISEEIKEIRIFSRDEKKQDDMRLLLKNPKVKFFIGDVRDLSSIENAIQNVDYVFHAAALKQVPSCEFYPIEALKTNSLGTENLLTTAIKANVEKVIVLSTDKAVYPINAMGISKAMMEKIAIAKSRIADKTKIMVTRYGNVMASRGSVIPLFVNQIKEGKPNTITDPKMTRFMMSLSEAVDLVLFAFKNGETGDTFVQKSPGCTLQQLSDVLQDIFNKKTGQVLIGTRHGEKIYETLLTREEKSKAEDMGNYYRIVPDIRDLNYNKYFSEGDSNINQRDDYNSSNTHQLSNKELKELLLSLDYIKNEL